MDYESPTLAPQEILFMKMQRAVPPTGNAPSASISTCQRGTCSIKKEAYEIFLIAG